MGLAYRRSINHRADLDIVKLKDGHSFEAVKLRVISKYSNRMSYC